MVAEHWLSQRSKAYEVLMETNDARGRSDPARRRVVLAAAAIMAGIGSGTAAAQDWPSKPIRLIVPFPAGTGTDVLGRMLAASLADALGQGVVVDNRTGAAGTLGADAVAKAAADGYTLLLGQTIPNAIAPFAMPFIPYKADAFTPIGFIGSLYNVLVVPASLGVDSVADFVALVKSKPGYYSYSSSGIGSTHHLAAIQFLSMHGLSMTHVPYKGSTQALPDMLSGQIAMRFDTVPPVLSSIQSGRLKALAISADQRVSSLPQVMTFKEAGIASVNAVNWYCLLGPRDMPQPMTSRLNALVVRAVADPQFQRKLEPQGFVPGAPMTPEQLAAFLTTEQTRFAKIVKELDITVRE
jgi:tripartite-type tricarboxylate transporter receptor subunit TctC